jgi:hypothetical protein
VTGLVPDVDAAIAILEHLADGLISGLLARDPGAGAFIAAALRETADGTPEEPGRWFDLGSAAVMRRLMMTWDRLAARAGIGPAV